MISTALASAQPSRYNLRTLAIDTSATPGLKSNVVAEIKLQGTQTVWLGTGKGLSVLRDSLTITTFPSKADLEADLSSMYLPEGGVSAIAVAGDSLFAAVAVSGGDIQIGAGSVFTNRSSDTTGVLWEYYLQHVDGEADSLAPFANGFFRALPVTVPQANVTYDAVISGGFVWTANWAGGLRRYNIASKTWDRVPLPEDDQVELKTCDPTAYEVIGNANILKDFYLNPRDPIDEGNHNHKAFSILAYGDTIWVGTANGINRGIQGDNCVDWVHYSFPTSGISGNFVVSLGRQDWNGQRIIWAATMNAEEPGEQRGLSYTVDDGFTWNTTLHGERVYNVIAVDSLVFASSERGLWKSEDGQNWALFKPAVDATPYQSDQILSNTTFAAALDTGGYYGNSTLWIGTPDGLARSMDLDGLGWRIYRAEYDTADVYAYPNPFSPFTHNILEGDGNVRFHTGPVAGDQIELAVYNFALEKVYSSIFKRNEGPGALKWNGRDQSGRLVANGVYFIRLEFAESTNTPRKDHWVKLIVVK